jgi:predicted transcriptional regulator
MTKEQIVLLLDQIETWPDEAQAELLRAAVRINEKYATVYRLSDEERDDLREGLAELQRGDIATEEEMQALFAALG